MENNNTNFENQEENKITESVQNTDESIDTNAGTAENASAEDDLLKAAVTTGKKKKSAGQEVKEWIVSLAVALLVVFVIRSFCFQIIKVEGTSMDALETYSIDEVSTVGLKNGERLFVTVFDALLGNIHRGDVVICRYPGRGTVDFVKRVVAVPGDTIVRKDGVTSVIYGDSGKEVAIDEGISRGGNDYEYVLDNEYFCVGDNRKFSHDSRSWDGVAEWDGVSTKVDYFGYSGTGNVGPVTGDMIIGKVRAVIWPFSSFRAVESIEDILDVSAEDNA